LDRNIFQEEHRIFRSAFQSFIKKDVLPHYDKWEEKRIVPREFWLQMGSQGYLCPQLEEKYGGMGADFRYNIIINEELAKVAMGTLGVPLHNDIIAPYLQMYCNEAQKRQWLPKCASGKAILAIAMTEPGAGSDLQSIKTTAIKDGDSYVLNGQKTFISNGISADLVLVACKTDPKAQPGYRGISLIMVERDTPGFIRGRQLDKIGMHSQDTAELFFEECRVPAANLVGTEGEGFKYMMKKLPHERLVVAVGCQAAAEEMLKETLEFTRVRSAFGKPIQEFQHTRFKLAEIATEIELGRVFVDRLIDRVIQGEDITVEGAMAKWWVSDMANRVAYDCLQLHGGYGYMEEYKIARWYRDIRVATIYAGSNEIMKEVIGRSLQ